jgi:pimeloyl-ACP methyl ester carboxylesterase
MSSVRNHWSAAAAGRRIHYLAKPSSRLLSVIFAVAVMLLTGCTLGPSERGPLATFGAGQSTGGGSPASTPPLGPGGPGQQADPINWLPCGDVGSVDATTGLAFDVDCAAVLVEQKTSAFGTEALQVARARAPGVGEDAPAVVVLLDQPGQNGRNKVATVAAGLSPAVRDHFAVITVDLIGTGESGPIDCLSGHDAGALVSLGVDPTEPASAAALADLSRSLTFECGDLAGADLSLLNTTEATDDLDALRSALGQSTLTLIGRGFGATLGAVYADRYPGRVGAAVLDAPADPLEDLDARAAAVAVAAEQALVALAARCPDFAGGCPLGADPRGRVATAVSTLDNLRGAAPGAGNANGGTVLLTLLLRLGDPAAWPNLATALAAAANGDSAPIEELLVESLDLDASTEWLNAAIIYGCNDSALRISPEQLSEAVEAVRPQAPLLGPFTVGLVGVCGSWPAPEAALGGVKATGAAPILIAGAVADPVSPYPAVRSLAGQLGSATLISWQSGNHGSYPASPCVTTAVDDYLLSGRLPAVGTLCPP